MKRNFFTKAVLAAAITCSIHASAQESGDTLTQTVSLMQADLDALKKVKLSGYLQAQYQVADSSAIASFAGGNFAANVDKRFMMRRGRMKAAYTGNQTQYVLQIDVTEKGVGIKDAYLKFTEPWANALTLTTGVFDRPFGYEIGYSSSQRESPERGRMSQIIFPGERELGAMLTLQGPKTSGWNFLKIDAGLFNGTGSTASDFDVQKDFIGRARIDRTTANEKIKYGLGASYYKGGWRQGTSTIYSMYTDQTGLNLFKSDKDTVHYGAISNRTYIGTDFQLSIDWPIGITTVRAEYIKGQQPGTTVSTASPSSQPTTDTYTRNFSGAYLYFLQNIWETKHQLVVKYDWYDPNMDVASDNIGKAATESGTVKTGKQDIKYKTIGIGWIYKWDNNVKIIAYYDKVENETSENTSGMMTDLKDNVFTLRVQYKF